MGQRLASAQRALVTHPLNVGNDREHRAKDDQRDAEQVPTGRDAGERRQQLDDAQPGDDEGERGPAPGEERPLVRESEPGIGRGLPLLARRRAG